jgi:hypothetical protein
MVNSMQELQLEDGCSIACNEKGLAVLGNFISSSWEQKINIYSKVKNYYKCQIVFRPAWTKAQ